MSEQLSADLNIIQSAPIELELLDGDLNIIQKLDDEPNDVGGLTSAELKAKFDESGNIIKKYINETLIPAVLAEDATEESRKQAEAARVAAEQVRQSNEETRKSNEAARVAAEQVRQSNEETRKSNEAARVTAEGNRATAEGTRANAEAARVQNETERKTAEASRASAETARANAETQRQSNEAARQNAESQRVSAESARNFWEDYSASKAYAVGNKVAYGGSSYLCIKPCTDIAPPNAEYWRLIAAKGNDGKGAPSDGAPKAAGTANAGVLETYSRSDHVHPQEVSDAERTAWNGKAAKALSFTVTLTVAGWSGNAQTVSNSNFAVSGYAYTVCPAGDSFAGYTEAVIYADDVIAAGKMTFHCSEKPTANLTVNILRTEASA